MIRQRLVPIVVVAIAGVVAITVTLAVLGGRSAPAVDGEFVLDEPGIYDQPADEVNAAVDGESLPDVAVVDRDGATVLLSEHRGTPLVVNFWFSRCAPCRRELRDFAEVHAEVGDRVRFVGVDPFDTVEAMEGFAAERGVTYELYRDRAPDGRLLTDELGIVAYPVTLFVAADGTILRQTGEIDAAELRAAIEELF
jgi:peroxiredoxin